MLLAELGEIALEGGVGAQLGDVFEAGAHIVAELAQIHIERRTTFLRHRGEGQHHRRVRHVAAADVEQPRHILRVGDHQRVGGDLFHLGVQALELVRGRLAGIAQLVRHHGAERRLRPVGPDGVDRIVLDRNQHGTRRSAGLGEPLGAFDRMQPRRIAEFCLRRQIVFDPQRRRILDHVGDGKNRAVDFFLHLHLITAVDEDHRAVGEHDGDAGRAGEAGQPGQLLGAGRHIFILEAVGARHDEAVEAAFGKLRPQRRHARRAFGALAAILERLEMGLEHQCNL